MNPELWGTVGHILIVLFVFWHYCHESCDDYLHS